MVEEKEVKWRSLYSISEKCKVCNRAIAKAKLNDKDPDSNNHKFTCYECGCTYTYNASDGLIRVLKIQ